MSRSANYIDENGNSRKVTISDADSIEAMRNDFAYLEKQYNPKYVQIQRIKAETGEAMHIRVTVTAPSHFLASSTDTYPKSCNSSSFDVICYPGYPLVQVKAFYPRDHYLASPNVFSSGVTCIDRWELFKSSLVTVVEKLVRDIIHDPNVTRYNSPANSKMIDWHKNGVKKNRFPTISPKLLFAPQAPQMPSRITTQKTVTPPSLPRRKH